jgi:hypothetical protein
VCTYPIQTTYLYIVVLFGILVKADGMRPLELNAMALELARNADKHAVQFNVCMR